MADDRTSKGAAALKRAMGADAYRAEANGGTGTGRTLKGEFFDDTGRMTQYMGVQDKEDHEREVQRCVFDSRVWMRGCGSGVDLCARG